jgi:hypothetical protein
LTKKDKGRLPLPSGLQVRIGKAYIAPPPPSVEITKRQLAEAREGFGTHREPILGSFRRINLPRDPIALAKLMRDIAPRLSKS